MFQPTSKKVLLAVLTGCFVVQSGLVYTDDVDIVLSDDAVEGRKLYHRHSCQVCHQLWGQGGFLGPDLTNAGSRVDQARLSSLLTIGSGQMPAFRFSDDEIRAVRAFLTEIDRADLGRGELRLGDPDAGTTPQAAFEASVTAVRPPPDVEAGFEVFRGGICSACHFPFQTSPVLAPDLSTAVERLGESELRQVLVEGRPDRGMPPPVPAFNAAEMDQVIAYLRWLNEHRDDLRARTDQRLSERDVDWSRLPWWEYK